MDANLQAAGYCVLLGFFLIGLVVKLTLKGRKHPPGPPGYPLVGNLALPQGPAWKAYRDLGNAYGEP